MVLDRVKHTLLYPEAARYMLKDQSLLYKVEEYGMGKQRRLEDYLENVAGLDMVTKQTKVPTWCHQGVPPPLKEFDHLKSMYE